MELTQLNVLCGRIPYTYHHDYVMMNADRANSMSRSEVAKMDVSEDELYACALLQAVESLTTQQKIFLNINKSLYYKCTTVAIGHLTKLNNKLGEDNASA